MPRVSVIVPAHNEEETISPCLSALLANDYPDFEIIVVDDGSTDRTVARVQSFFNDCRIRLLEQPSNMGSATARNLGIHLSAAEYLFFCDADCIVAHDWISQGVASLEQEGIIAVEGGMYYQNSAPSLFHYVPLNPFYNLYTACLTVPGQDYSYGNFAVKRTAAEKLGGFNALRYQNGREDTDFGYRLRQHGQIAFNPNMRAVHKEEQWTAARLAANACRYAADVRFYKDHHAFCFRLGRVLHPKLLLMLVFPPLLLTQFRFHSLRELAFLPRLYGYLLRLRLTIWKTAIAEKVLLF